jgi:hypothetical protein
MQQDPFAPKYGNVPATPIPTYGGMPVQPPKKHMNILLVPLILTVVFLLAAIGFGVWAFMSRQDYKNNVDPKIASAVAIAQEQTKTEKDKEFIEKEKAPYKTYSGPQVAGSLSIQYPKTWSAFVTETESGSNLVDGYFHPNFVPGVQSGTDFALRVKVVSKSYDEELKQFESKAKQGKVRISPYKAAKLPAGTVGARIDGEINPGQQDSLILFPLRDKTIEFSTESAQFVPDFDSIIMANMTFAP